MAFQGQRFYTKDGGQVHNINGDQHNYHEHYPQGAQVNKIGRLENANFGTNYGAISQTSGRSPAYYQGPRGDDWGHGHRGPPQAHYRGGPAYRGGPRPWPPQRGYTHPRGAPGGHHYGRQDWDGGWDEGQDDEWNDECNDDWSDGWSDDLDDGNHVPPQGQGNFGGWSQRNGAPPQSWDQRNGAYPQGPGGGTGYHRGPPPQSRLPRRSQTGYDGNPPYDGRYAKGPAAGSARPTRQPNVDIIDEEDGNGDPSTGDDGGVEEACKRLGNAHISSEPTEVNPPAEKA